jgi:hypothetical protein
MTYDNQQTLATMLEDFFMDQSSIPEDPKSVSTRSSFAVISDGIIMEYLYYQMSLDQFNQIESHFALELAKNRDGAK